MIRVGFRWLERGSCRHPQAMTIRGGSLCAVDFPALVGVIDHPDRGLFLFDTGYDPAFIDIRRRDRRLPVRLHVTSHGDGIDMAIEQAAPDLGLMSRFLERDRTRSISRYYPPTIVQARWQGERGLTLCVTAIFTPATEGSFMPFARFSTPRGFAPGWLKQAAIRLFLRPVVAQDRRALAAQHGVMTHFGNPRFVAGPGDILGNRLHRLWKGERLPPGRDAPVDAEL